jgi:hypothetical protein
MKYDQSVLRNMSFLELIGAIFVRSQLIEQIMRELILAKEGYVAPADFEKKTFGWLLNKFATLYPEIKENDVPPEWKEHLDMSLYASLKDANEVRNDAAHGEYLVHVTLIDLMPGKDAKGINRLTMKAIRENASIMDKALIDAWNFRIGILFPS